MIPELGDPDRVRATWVCVTCGYTFLRDAVPFIRCVKLHHCHAGDLLLCADGSAVYVPHPLDCEIVSVLPE